MKSIYKDNFFDAPTFKTLKDFVFSSIIDESTVEYGEEFKRYYKIVFLPDELKNMLLDKARQETGDKSLEVIYSQVVRYQIKDQNIPELRNHKDIVTGEWVMDIVIDSTIDWPLIIEDQIFSNTPNTVIFIKGEDDFHSRPDFPSEDQKDYVLLLFVHLAKKDSEYYRVGKQIFSMKQEMLASFLKTMKPSWTRYGNG